jgi:hypothetical protein
MTEKRNRLHDADLRATSNCFRYAKKNLAFKGDANGLER